MTPAANRSDACARGLALQLLRRHVRGSAEQGGVGGDGGLAGAAGQAQVQQDGPGPVAAAERDVGRLDVAVHRLLLVHVPDPGQQAPQELHRLVDGRQLAGADPPGYVAARDVLEDQRRALLPPQGDGPGAEQPDDVRAGHAAEPVHLPLQAVGRVGPVEDDLDGGVVPPPGLAERAGTQARDGAS